jgi:diaminopimelate epimerase
MSHHAGHPFWKMNGIGNDFVILDARTRTLNLSSEQARLLADREGPYGCDQIIVLKMPQTKSAHVRMDIFNTDGTLSGACGNATRCVAWLISNETKLSDIVIESEGGLLQAHVSSTQDIQVDMGPARRFWSQIPLREPVADTSSLPIALTTQQGQTLSHPFGVSMGNPHMVFFVEEPVEAFDLASFGPDLEHHPLFPERANVSIAQLKSDDHIELRVWERGAGQTLACGTAACATQVAAFSKNLTKSSARISQRGGDLWITIREDGHVIMAGPSAMEREGEVPWPLLEPQKFETFEGA